MSAGLGSERESSVRVCVWGGGAERQVGTVDLDDGADCMAKFASNRWVGAAVFLGVVAGKLAG